jgi:hypothetical protein
MPVAASATRCLTTPDSLHREIRRPLLSTLMRIALGLEYCGTAYNGWQSQLDGRGIQDAVLSNYSVEASHTASRQ